MASWKRKDLQQLEFSFHLLTFVSFNGESWKVTANYVIAHKFMSDEVIWIIWRDWIRSAGFGFRAGYDFEGEEWWEVGEGWSSGGADTPLRLYY